MASVPRRRYLLDGRPVEFTVSYRPLDLARDTPIAQPNPGPCGIYARLEELGHHLDHFVEVCDTVMAADATTACPPPGKWDCVGAAVPEPRAIVAPFQTPARVTDSRAYADSTVSA